MSDMPAGELGALLTGDVDEWIQVLPQYQRNHIEQMLKTAEPTEVAITWLSNSGPMDTAPFGGVRTGAALFYDNLLNEMQKLFCGDEEYAQERQELNKVGAAGKMFVVAGVSTAISPYVGAAAVVIGPAVALILAVLCKTTTVTACQGIAGLIDERKAKASDSSSQ